jgi:hypothetical protein
MAFSPLNAGYSPLNAGYSPLNAVTAALPLNVLADDKIMVQTKDLCVDFNCTYVYVLGVLFPVWSMHQLFVEMPS